MVPEILRIGVDLVSVARLRRALAGREERWRRRVFGAGEWQAAHQEADPAAALAACFAAKEAAFKALGSGWGGGVAWLDVQVDAQAAEPGALLLAGRARELAAGWRLSVSTTRTDEVAAAMVVAQAV